MDDEIKENKIIFVMVGLPARGKSYIAKKIVGYVTWTGYQAKVFNVGNYRRNIVHEDQSQAFFDSGNIHAKNLREKLAMDVLTETIKWLDEGGNVAVFDATNTTEERRISVLGQIKASGKKFNAIFLESICEDKAVLESNFQEKIRNSPDYKNMPYEEAVKDLAQRIENYRKVYEPVDNDAYSYIKLINLQSKVVCNKIYGHLAHRIVAFLMGIHVEKRPIWLTRTGQSMHWKDINSELTKVNPENSDKALQTYLKLRIEVLDTSSEANQLSEKGKLYAKKLAYFIQWQCQNLFTQEQEDKINRTLSTSIIGISKEQAVTSHYSLEKASPSSSGLVPGPIIYSSTLPRALETIKEISSPSPPHVVSALNMIDTGITNSENLEQVKKEMSQDPFNYRLPCGESYADLIQRLDPFVVELERIRKPVVIVSHLSTLQALYAYFSDVPVADAPLISIPHHTVIQLVPNQYGWIETRFNLDNIDLELLQINRFLDKCEKPIELKNAHYTKPEDEKDPKRQKT